MELIKEDLPRIRRKPGFWKTRLNYPKYAINERLRIAPHLTDRGDHDPIRSGCTTSLLVIDSLVAVAIFTDVQ